MDPIKETLTQEISIRFHCSTGATHSIAFILSVIAASLKCGNIGELEEYMRTWAYGKGEPIRNSAAKVLNSIRYEHRQTPE